MEGVVLYTVLLSSFNDFAYNNIVEEHCLLYILFETVLTLFSIAKTKGSIHFSVFLLE